jgi:hypothetical protein
MAVYGVTRTTVKGFRVCEFSVFLWYTVTATKRTK